MVISSIIPSSLHRFHQIIPLGKCCVIWRTIYHILRRRLNTSNVWLRVSGMQFVCRHTTAKWLCLATGAEAIRYNHLHHGIQNLLVISQWSLQYIHHFRSHLEHSKSFAFSSTDLSDCYHSDSVWYFLSWLWWNRFLSGTRSFSPYPVWSYSRWFLQVLCWLSRSGWS